MRRFLLASAGALSALTLAGCMGGDLYGPPPGYADVEYDGYYDGFYGPFPGGYWGPSGMFYYPDHRTGRFHPDIAHHVRRNPQPGFNPIHGRAPSAAGRGRQGGHGPGPASAPRPHA